MNYLVLGLTLISFNLFAASPVATVVDLLRSTPASVSGNISMDGPLQLWEDKSGIIDYGLRVKAKRDIGFSFSDKHISISTEKAIELTVSGVPIKVKSIYYHSVTGKFEVKTDLPLGIGEKALNAHLSKKITDMYKPKVLKAFKVLKDLRHTNKLSDVAAVTGVITNIFTEGSPPTKVPVIRGNVELSFHPEKNRKLKLDQWNAEIKGGDSISAGMDFVRNGPKLTVGAVEFRSVKGIRISGKTNYPEIASVDFNYLRADSSGINFNYEIGAEEVIAGFRLLMNVVKAHAGHPGDLLRECDPVRLEAIRKSIDGNLKREISAMIRTHRKSLLGNGISPQLLAALD